MEIVAVLVVLVVIVAVECRIYSTLVLKNVEYHLYLSKKEAFEGETIEIIEEVINKKLLPVPWLKSEISTSRWLEFSSSKVNEISDSRFVPSVFVLKPFQKCIRKRKVKCLKRGVFQLNDTVILGSDIFGFVSQTKRVSVNGSLVVLPSPFGIKLGEMSKREYYGELTVRRFMCEDPFVVSGVRESTGREPMSKIHWNSTARNGRLMVFNNEYTTTNRVLIVMNMCKSDEGGIRPLMSAELETYIKATAFLLDYYSVNGVSAAFAANGSGDNGIFIPLGGGREFFTGILRRLALVENTCALTVSEMLENLGTEEYTDIIFFTNYVNSEMAEFAAEMSFSGIEVGFYCNDDSNRGVETVRIGRVSLEKYGA